jgi:chorismate-pyruvate lyase
VCVPPSARSSVCASVDESISGGDFVRRIELGRDGEPWIYAETTVPAVTLAHHPWLAAIGPRSLGEVLAAFAGAVRRSDFEFALLDGDAPIVARACALAGAPAQRSGRAAPPFA